MKTHRTDEPGELNIVIDNSLKKFKGQNFFPEKLKKANEILAHAGLPDFKKLKK